MKKTVITYGTFDLFHIGHLNILRRAKEYGDYLIVGVTSESYDRSRGKLNVVQDVNARLDAIEKLDFVDKVIVETHKGQKKEDVIRYNVDKFIIGDDWVGKFDYLSDVCDVIYLPRTKDISSTLLRKDIENINVGVIGTGRISSRFASEIKYVDGIEINSVFSRNILNVEKYILEHDILYGYDKLTDFLDSDIDAVYIACPHEFHYEYCKKSLMRGKHTLCEKPMVLDDNQLKELMEIAKEKQLILLEGIKTAFFPAFHKLQDEIKSGIIGDVVEVKATFTKLVNDLSLREWSPPYGGATNELASYPLLLAVTLLGDITSVSFNPRYSCGVDSSNTIICNHNNGALSISTVGIGIKSEGCAVISGTKGYIFVPAPWWLTKEFVVRFEDPNKEYRFSYEFEGDGLRYEIAEFKTLIQRKEHSSKMFSNAYSENINKVLSDFNRERFR